VAEAAAAPEAEAVAEAVAEVLRGRNGFRGRRKPALEELLSRTLTLETWEKPLFSDLAALAEGPKGVRRGAPPTGEDGGCLNGFAW
jgi:hypothetical protein